MDKIVACLHFSASPGSASPVESVSQKFFYFSRPCFLSFFVFANCFAVRLAHAARGGSYVDGPT